MIVGHYYRTPMLHMGCSPIASFFLFLGLVEVGRAPQPWLGFSLVSGGTNKSPRFSCSVKQVECQEGHPAHKKTPPQSTVTVHINNPNNCVNGTATSCDGAAHGRVGVSCEHRPTVIPLSHRSSTESIRIGTLNVGTMRGRSSEIVEMITRRYGPSGVVRNLRPEARCGPWGPLCGITQNASSPTNC